MGRTRSLSWEVGCAALCALFSAGCERRERAADETARGEPPRAEQVPMTTPTPMPGQPTPLPGQRAAEQQAALSEAERRGEVEEAPGAVQAESGEACPDKGTQAGASRGSSTAQKSADEAAAARGSSTEQKIADEMERRGELESSSGAVGAERGSAAGESAEPTMLTGRVFYGGPTLPDDAEIHVVLLGADTNAVLAEQVLSAEGDPPYTFELPIARGSEAAADAQSVRVIIEDNGQVLYSTLQPFTPNLAERSVLPVQVQAD